MISTLDTLRLCLQGGVARRVDATAYVDVFSYLSSESRHTVAARLVPARITFDAGGRPEEGSAESTAGLEAVLREIEIASMAKVCVCVWGGERWVGG